MIALTFLAALLLERPGATAQKWGLRVAGVVWGMIGIFLTLLVIVNA